MKHLILLLSFCFITSLLTGQSNARSSTIDHRVDISIYPNPVIDFFKINDNGGLVDQIAVYNLAGRKIKSFNYTEGQKYFVGDLPKGMYLIQLINEDRHTLATRRVSVR